MGNDFLLLKNKNVLFVEDDLIMLEQINELLEMIFQSVYSAKNGQEAFELFEEENIDLIISDIKMPVMDGLTLIEKIRKVNYDIPIILLTNYSEKDYLLHAANLSIDGYIFKPIEYENLVQTVIKAMKRSGKNQNKIFLSNKIFFNIATQELYFNDEVVSLGVKELELIKLLIDNSSKTVTKEEISKVLWPFESVSESSIKNLILRIRKKINSDIILSVRGIGYRLNKCIDM
ncbi:response regulator transcription factor [Arcobacter sp.]|uniref:response regulator transcription factor n=1 Tax=Arcobacter sp. TaxID=1872629 RepID=UPI003D108C64